MLHEHVNELDALHINMVVRELVDLVLLFDIYTIYQQLQIFRFRYELVRREELFRLISEHAAGMIAVIAMTTENVSASGCLCNCTVSLIKGTPVDVFLTFGGAERHAGRAHVVRKDSTGAAWNRYGFQFVKTTSDWVLQAN